MAPEAALGFPSSESCWATPRRARLSVMRTLTTIRYAARRRASVARSRRPWAGGGGYQPLYRSKKLTVKRKREAVIKVLMRASERVVVWACLSSAVCSVT